MSSSRPPPTPKPSSSATIPPHDADADSSAPRRPGPWPPRVEPLPSDHGHDPHVLRSWARRTGFKSTTSGEAAASSEIANAAPSQVSPLPKPPGHLNRPSDRDPQKVVPKKTNARKENHRSREAVVTDAGVPLTPAPAPGPLPPPPAAQRKTRDKAVSKDLEVGILALPQDDDDEFTVKQAHIKYELRENPGLVPLFIYGFQHYLSIMGSIILVPLVIVPAMGGSDVDTAKVVSTVLLVTGLSTLMHTFLGSRLPLIQGSSFVYLVPALVIINSTELQSLGSDRFKHTMRELQGSVIIASACQAFIGYSGLMSVLLRLINPVVVAPTVAAIGLAFFSYGFPVVGSCVEIGVPQILVVIFFALHLRKISFLGNRVFQVYAVPLGLAITWAYAFLLTAAGAYNYNGCSIHIPAPNVVSEECRKHVYTMMHCRTDVSTAMKTAAWFSFPYPFQWGMPVFHWKNSVVMIAASVIATVDSVGSYHASSLLVAAGAPTPGVVNRGIGLEGLTSILAGLWGTGTGATTLTENVHTIAVTKIGNRRVVELGACVLVLMSFVGKIGAFIASVPQVIVAGLLCVMWSMLTAFGLSNLRYSETGSSRNVLIVGLSLFLSLSVPLYFQHYAAGSIPATVASYFQPYTVATHGPVRTGITEVDFLLNSILSMNMLIAFLVAFVLDNTVPGSRQERGMYVWSKPSAAKKQPDMMKDYSLPSSLGKFFGWARWVGI